MDALSRSVADDVRRQIAPAQLKSDTITESEVVTNSGLLARQLIRGPDRRVSRHLATDHRADRFDWVVVFANEGHWIADYVTAWDSMPKPLTGLVMMDPIDQIFLLAHDRPNRRLRRFMNPLYPLLHEIEFQRIRRFDRLYAISQWTSQLCAHLYGVPPPESLAAVDEELFQPRLSIGNASPYIAVPTISVGDREESALRDLARRDLPLVTFGPRAIDGIPHEGFLTETELVSFLARARLTLFLFDYEGLGLLPLESLAVGTPVVTLPKGGPLAELRGNEFVHFAQDLDSIYSEARSLLDEARPPGLADEIRSSITTYFAARVAERWGQSLGSLIRS